jgi:hypothetical protein
VSDGIRPKNAPKVGDWGLEWVRDRVKFGHHQVLAKYLRYRTPEQRAEADADGLTVEVILRTAFLVANGHTAVPQAAIKVYRHLPDAPASPVIAICRASREGYHVKDLAKAIVKKVPRESMDEDTRLFVDEMTIRHVMET